MYTKFSASVVCMDPLDLKFHIDLLTNLKVDLLHIDFMDGHNVPRYGINPEIMRRIPYITDMPMDVHLMVSDVEFCYSQMKGIQNIENLTFHVEGNEGNLLKLIDYGKTLAKNVGVVLNMSSNTDAVKRLSSAGLIDTIMFMAIHPGVLVQKSRPEVLYNSIRDVIGDTAMKYVCVDGGVTFDSINPLITAGANCLVGGTGTIYKGVDFSTSKDTQTAQIMENWVKIKKAINNV